MSLENIEEWKRKELQKKANQVLPHLMVRYKYVWGRHLYEPINNTAKKMLSKTNRKNFSLEQIKELESLGVIVDVITPDIDVISKKNQDSRSSEQEQDRDEQDEHNEPDEKDNDE